MSDLIPKLTQMDEHGSYKTVMELPRKGKIIRAVIRAAVDSESPYLWQVASRAGDVYFRTLNEAKSYCQDQGWL